MQCAPRSMLASDQTSQPPWETRGVQRRCFRLQWLGNPRRWHRVSEVSLLAKALAGSWVAWVQSLETMERLREEIFNLTTSCSDMFPRAQCGTHAHTHPYTHSDNKMKISSSGLIRVESFGDDLQRAVCVKTRTSVSQRLQRHRRGVLNKRKQNRKSRLPISVQPNFKGKCPRTAQKSFFALAL